MTTSEKLRLLIALACFLVFLVVRYGLVGKLREKWQAKQREDVKTRQLAERKDRRKQARQEQQAKKAQTAEILRHGLGAFQQKSVQAAGQDIWYLEGGTKPGAPSILLLHGFAGDKENWTEVGRQLIMGGYQVIAPDLPGFGQNLKNPDRPYDVTSQAKRIRAFIQKLKLQNLHIVGHSIGGSIAAAVSYAGSEEIASLTLIEPFGVHVPYPSELDELLKTNRNPMVIANPAAYNNLLGFIFHQRPEMPAALKKHRAELASENRIFYLKMWKEIREGERANLLDLLLPEIKNRTLVIQGAQSKVIHPATPDIIRSMMRDMRPAVIENCGHFPMVEQPQQTADHILEFLRSIPAPTSTA